MTSTTPQHRDRTITTDDRPPGADDPVGIRLVGPVQVPGPDGDPVTVRGSGAVLVAALALAPGPR